MFCPRVHSIALGLKVQGLKGKKGIKDERGRSGFPHPVNEMQTEETPWWQEETPWWQEGSGSR